MKRGGFDQLCGVSAALDVIGDRWALLVVRELLFSAKRFTDLQRGLPGIGSNTLTMRLAELEEAGVLRKRTTAPPLSVTAYELTERGRSLTPALIALVRWGAPALAHKSPKHRLQPTWLALAMLAFFDRAHAPDRSVRIALMFPSGSLALALGPAGLEITEGESGPQELTVFAANPEVMVALFRGLVTIAQATKKKDLRAEGDVTLLAPLLASFRFGGAPNRG